MKRFSPLLLGIIIGTLLVAAAAGVYFWNKYREEAPLKEDTGPKIEFARPKKSAHYESNTPAHGQILPDVPINVVVNFNFDLVSPSSITIISNGDDYGVGETAIDANKLTLRRKMHPAAPDGTYTVKYKACWPDGSCHDGHFQFAIDRTVIESGYFDLRGRKEVLIDMRDVSFEPRNIIISKGTKVLWRNDDPVSHYVNTDSHPAHTYFPAQNSRELKNGDIFTLVFDQPGAYPYHCSAHYGDSMTGMILVE